MQKIINNYFKYEKKKIPLLLLFLKNNLHPSLNLYLLSDTFAYACITSNKQPMENRQLLRLTYGWTTAAAVRG